MGANKSKHVKEPKRKQGQISPSRQGNQPPAKQVTNYDIRFGTGRYILNSIIGKGAFGIVVSVEGKDSKELFALKIEKLPSKCAKKEIDAYKKLQGVDGIPFLHSNWEENNCMILQLELVGVSLYEHVRKNGGKLNPEEIFDLAPKMIDLVERIHEKGFVHCDIKPSNIAFGLGHRKQTLYLLDFGLADRYIDETTGQHCKEHVRMPRGTRLYMSANQHKCLRNTRRDDMESVVYSMMDMCDVNIPWKTLCSAEIATDHISLFDAKLGNTDGSSISEIQEFTRMLKMCRGLGFQDKPNYVAMKNLFQLTYEMKLEMMKRRYNLPSAPVKIKLTAEDKKLLKKFDVNNCKKQGEYEENGENKEASSFD